MSVAPMGSVDLVRRFSEVTFEEVRLPSVALVGDPGVADEQVASQLDRALVLSCAESVGAMQTAFDMTVES